MLFFISEMVSLYFLLNYVVSAVLTLQKMEIYLCLTIHMEFILNV